MEVNNQNIITKWQKIISIILLVLTTVLWGTTFIITKNLTKSIPIFLYLGLRYFIAFLVFLPFLYQLKTINKKLIIGGVFTGTLYFFSIVFQTFGIQTTTAGKAGFITGLSTIMVPFLTWIIRKKKVSYRIWFAVVLSLIGMAFLLLENESGVILGDLLVLGCALFCALFIIFNDDFVSLVNIYLYSLIQLITLAILCFGSSFLFLENYNLLSTDLNFWLIMLYMGFGTTSLTFLFQNWGQKYQDPSVTAIIFTLEPVFAAFFGFLLGNEILTLFNWIGMSLIFGAILITVLKKRNKKNKKKE